MAWDPPVFVDGDTLATKLNQIWSSSATDLNAIGEDSIRDGCFQGGHGGGLCSFLESVDSGSTITVYNYLQSDYSGSLVYSSFGNSNGSDTLVNVGVGDRIIVGHYTTTTSGPRASLTFSASEPTGMDNASDPQYKQGGLLIMGDVALVQWDPGDYTATSVSLMLCFRYRVSATWYTIPTSERFWRLRDFVFPYGTGTPEANDYLALPIGVRELLTKEVQAELEGVATSAVGDVEEVQMMMALKASGGTSGLEVSLGNWNLTAIGLYAEDP